MTPSASSNEPLTVYGGRKPEKQENVANSRQKLLKQLASLDEAVYEHLKGLVTRFTNFNPVLKSGARSTASRTRSQLSRFMTDAQTIIKEQVGSTAGGVNAVVDLEALKEALATDLTVTEIEEARTSRSSSLYGAVGDSLKEFVMATKSRMEPLKPPKLASPSLASTGLTSGSQISEGFVEYEQPLSSWENDYGALPDLDTALVVTPIKKSAPYKFVLVSIDSDATESDIKRAVAEACENHEVHVTDVEIFTDLVANKQRKHAFVAVQTLGQLQTVLNDRIRAFGVHINGQRSSIVDVEEKNIVSIVTRPPMDNTRIEMLLKDLGIMNLVQKDSGAPSDPIVSSNPLFSAPPRQHSRSFSIFAPRDGNGDLIGKAWITFPSHASAYAGYHSLSACRPGAIRAFWSQKSPNHFEEAIKIRDALAAENAELRQKVATLTGGSSATVTAKITNSANAGSEAVVDEMSLDYVMATHIRKVMHTVRGDISQAARVLNISEKALQLQLRKIRPLEAEH